MISSFKTFATMLLDQQYLFPVARGLVFSTFVHRTASLILVAVMI